MQFPGQLKACVDFENLGIRQISILLCWHSTCTLATWEYIPGEECSGLDQLSLETTVRNR